MRAASALSEHPVAAHAVGEVAGALLEQLGSPVDLLFVFVARAHTGAVEDIGAALRELLAPTVLVGTTACGVLERDAEVEERPALAVWAASGIDALPVRIEAGTVRIEDAQHWQDHHMVLLADPYTTPLDRVIANLKHDAPQLQLHGGLASAATAAGGNRLLLDDSVYNSGSVGVRLSGTALTSVVSQGCRPIGKPLTVTELAGGPNEGAHIITRLASQPPMDVLRSVAADASEAERALMSQGVHIGIVLDERLHEFDRGDFLIRGVMGADPNNGAIAVGAELEVGTTVQFHVRDAKTASEDLVELMSGQRARAALTFTCNGRGERLFGRPNHDAEIIHDLSGSTASAGMFCAGEIGPVGSDTHVHGFTASTLLFH